MTMIKPYNKCKKCGVLIVGGDLCEDCKPMTNADRIRQMTDEELAEWLDHVAGCGVCVLNEGKYRYSGDHCAHEYDCIQYIEKWLKQGVKNDDERR